MKIALVTSLNEKLYHYYGHMFYTSFNWPFDTYVYHEGWMPSNPPRNFIHRNIHETNPELQKFLQDVRSKFLTIVMIPKPGKAGRASVTVNLMIGKTMLSSSSITMTDTGIGAGAMTKSTGQIKTNFWFNFNNF